MNRPKNAKPVAELNRVSFVYPRRSGPGSPGARPALEDVDLRIEEKDFLGVIGPNGGGKTTLLKILLGLLEPQRGRVRVFGERPAKVRHRIGYVPQSASVDSSVPASVLDIVLLGRLARSSWGLRFGRPHVEAARAALAQVALSEHEDQPFAELSGGQRQRVLIARALAADAELLLLDEPTTGIDPRREKELLYLLLCLNERLPIVMVSHDISLVSSHLKRVVCVNGRLTRHAAREVSPEVVAEVYNGPVAVLEDLEPPE